MYEIGVLKVSAIWFACCECHFLQEKLRNIKLFQKAKYAQLIEAFRIAPDAEEGDEDLDQGSSSSSKLERTQKIQKFFTNLEVYNKMEKKTEVCYFTKRQFVGYYVTHELMSKNKARDKWRKNKANPAVKSKTNEEGKLMLPVRMPLSVREVAGMSRAASNQEEEHVQSSDDELVQQDRQKRQKPQNFTDAELAAFDVYLQGLAGAAPESEDSGSDKEEEPPDEPQEEEPEELTKMRRIMDLGKGGLDSLDLVQARRNTRNLSDHVQKMLSKKIGIYYKLSCLADKLDEDEDSKVLGLREHLRQWDASAQRLRDLAVNTKTWTAKGCKANYSEGTLPIFNQLLSIAKDGLRLMNSGKGVRKDQQAAAAAKRRRLTCHTRKVLGNTSLVKQGLQRCLMTYLVEDVLQIKEDSQDININSGTFGADFDLNEFVLGENEGQVLHNLGQQVTTLLATELSDATRKLEKYHNKNSKDLVATICLKVPDEFSAVAWAKGLKHNGHDVRPHGVSTFARPSLLSSKRFGFRAGHDHFPFTGCSGILVGVAGSVVVLSLDLSAIVQDGGECSESFSVIDNLTPAEASDYMQKHASIVELKALGIITELW